MWKHVRWTNRQTDCFLLCFLVMLRRWSCSRWYRPRCCSPVLSSPSRALFWFFASQAASIAYLYASSSSLLSAPLLAPWLPSPSNSPTLLLRSPSCFTFDRVLRGLLQASPLKLYVPGACVEGLCLHKLAAYLAPLYNLNCNVSSLPRCGFPVSFIQ